MDGNTANDLVMEMEEESENKIPINNTMQDTIREMSETLYKNFPEKTSVLSSENINGCVRIDVINGYMERNFGYRYDALDTLVKSKNSRMLSKDGFGIASIIEFVKSIQASFEQTQIPDRLRDIYRK